MPISQLELDEAIALSDQNPNDLELAEAAITIADSFQFEKQQRQEATRTIFTDENHGFTPEQLSDFTNMVNGDEERKYKLLNKRYFQELGGIPKDQVDSNIDQLINAYGLKEYNRPISSHKEFFDSIKADFNTQDQVSAMAGEFAVNNVGTLMAESQFLERMEGVPGYAGREEKWKEELFNRKFSIDSRLDPHRTTIKLLSSALMTKESVGVEATTMEQVMADRQEVVNAPSYEELSQLVMGVPAEDRKLVISAAIAASANDEAGRKSVLKGLLESLDRGIEGMAADIKGVGNRSLSIAMQRDIASGVEVPVGKEASPEEYLEAVRLRVMGGDAYELQAGVMGVIAGKQFAAPSEEVKQQALKLAENEFQVGELADQLRSAAQNEIDPISSEFIAVRGLYSAAQSVPYLVTSLARGGFAINAMSLAGDSYRSLREQNPAMTAEQAQTVSMIAGPAQAYVEGISGKLLTGRLPAFNRFFNQILGTKGSIPARYLTRTAATTGAEMFQENVQQLTPFMVQGIISAVSEDMPNVPVGLLYEDMVAQQPELFFAVLPLAIMGGGVGTYSDFRNGRALLSSFDELRYQGLSEEASADIRALAAKKDYDGAQSRLREEFKTLGKDQKSVQEARAEVLPKLLAEQAATLKAMKDGMELDILPAILNERGKFTLRFTNGETMQYETHAEAMERFDAIASSSLVSMHVDQVAAARLTTSQIEQGREVKFILSPLRPTTEELQGQGVATEEQLAKRKEIEELNKGITPKDEERRAQVLAGMAANSSEARIASSYVLGSSQNTEGAPDSFGDRVIRTTARLYAGATAFTVIEETAEGDVKFMLQESGVPRKWLISALRQWESTTGDALFRKSITDDKQVENQDIVEAYSKMVVSYFASRAKAGDQGRIFSKEFRKEIADALRGDMGAVMSGYGSFFEAVYRRAAMIEKARKEGTLPADLESFLAKSAGMSPQKVFEREVVKEGEGIARELQRGPQLDPQVTVVEEGEDFRRTMLPDGSIIEGPATLSIVSFHGTPHTIPAEEGFRMDKVGTGEGAQVYGYGLYSAGAKSTAEYYQKSLTDPSLIPLHFDGRPLNTPYTDEIRERWSDYYQALNEIDADAMDELLSNLSQADDISVVNDALGFVSSKAKSLYQRIVKPKLSKPDLGTGNLYTLELFVEQEDLLDWDKPLIEQSEKVKAAILKVMAGGDQDLEALLDLSPDGMMMMGMLPSAKGSAAYGTIGDPQKASERLLAAGIPGIRYLDGNSRSAGEGSYNYVIFDEKLIKILEENGTPVTGPADAGTTLSVMTPAVDPRYSDINLFREYWNSKGVRNMTDVSYSGTQYEHIRPREIEVKKQDRGKGLGTAFMEDLIRFADLNGMQVRLNPSAELGATSRTRLDKFYKRFGFVENKPGKNKDYTISERFYRNPVPKTSTSFSTITPAVDAEYLALAADPEKNQDRLQEMVDGAARMAGYRHQGLFHGSGARFNRFMREFLGSAAGGVSANEAFFLTDSERTARGYAAYAAEEGPVKRLMRDAEIAEKSGDWDKYEKLITQAEDMVYGEEGAIASAERRKNAVVYSLFARGDFLEVDAEGKSAEEFGSLTAMIQKARQQGLDGVIFKNLDDAPYLNDPSTHFAIFSPNQIKSADPVTYDESGNVIPLSQRFNPARDEISFSTVSAVDDRPARVKKKTSLRIQMSRSALTDAALNQASWRDWYDEHQEVLDDFFGEYAQLFQDILSITSQAASVKANVALALKAFGLYVRGESFDARQRGQETPGFLDGVIMNLDRLRNDKQLQGQKIKAYKASNDGEVDQAVIDRHISRLLFGVETPSAAQFAKAQKVLSEIAKNIGWTPRQVQAALWAHSIYKSGKTPESYGAYLTKLESKGTLAKRIGDIGGRGASRDADGGGRGRFAPASTTPGEKSFSVIRPIGDIDSRFTAMFSPFHRSPELRAKLGQEMRRRALEVSKTLAPILRANRTAKSIDAERKQRFDALWQEKMEARISPSELSAIEAGKLDDASTRPILSELLRKKTYKRKDGKTVEYWAGSLMSKAEAKRRGMDTTSGEWDDIPEGLPGYVYGGGLAPDQAASMFGFDSIADFWSALESEIASWKNIEAISERISREIADITREARSEARAWANQALKERGTIGSDRATLIGFLRTLDAIQRTLPVEVRGKIGGFVALAKLSTPAAMLEEIERRVERIDSELEKYLKKEAEVRRKKLFKLAKPKREAGKKPKGKAGADIHDLFDRLTEAMLWDGSKAEGWATTLEAEIASGELSPEAEAHAKIEANLVRLFSDWNDTYIDTGKKGKNGRRIVKLNSRGADAARRTAAVEAAEEVWKAGYLAEQTRIAKERERRAQIRADIIKGTGKLGNRPERAVKAQKDAGLSGQWKEWFLSLFNFDQVLGFAFGAESKWTTWFADQQRTAENQKIDEIQSVLDGLDNLFRTLGGSRLGGEKLQWKLSQQSFATKQGGMMSELEGITAILMWRQEDGKRHMKGKRDENGKITSTWAYDQSFIDEIGRNLSKEGLAVMDYLINQYAGEYETLNPIFREINGINLPRNDKYSPLSVKPQQAPNGQTTDPVTGSTMSNGSMTPGSLRTRAQVVAEPDFRNAIEVFVGHKKQLAHWKAFAVFVRDAQGVLGNREVSNSIEASSGQEAVRVIRSWLDLFAQGGVRDAGSHLALTKALAGATGRAAAIQLVGRLGTLAIQTTQLGAAAAKMPFISYVSRLSKLLTGRLAWGDALNSPYIQRRLAEMPVSIQLAMEGLRAKKPNAIKHAVQRIGRLLSGTDALFTAGTFAIVYDYQLTKAIKAGVDPVTAGEVARNEAERIVDEIAQPTRQGTRSLFEATATNPLGRVSWAFASEARKNMALIAYTGAKRPTKELSRALFYVIAINGVLASLIRTAWKDLRDDDEDEDEWSLQRMLLSVATEPLYGFPGFGEIAQDAIFASAGEWKPSGSILDAPVKAMPAIVRAPENFAMLLEGDLEQPLRDLETILMAGGLFNENIAALSSLSHVIRDAEGLIRNFTQE